MTKWGGLDERIADAVQPAAARHVRAERAQVVRRVEEALLHDGARARVGLARVKLYR